MDPDSSHELARRALLAGVVALVVARPVVSGEDPGLTAPFSLPGNLVLTQLWLVLAALWFCWRLWADVRRWIGGLIDLGLLLLAVLMFLGAGLAAPYKHPAWLIAWEWAGYLAAFTLVRQIAVKDRDRVGLFSALLAAGVMVALAGVLQWLELLTLAGADRAQLRDAIVRHHAGIPLDESYIDLLVQEVQQRQPFATFNSSSAFASFLLLVVPGVVGTGFITYRRRAWWRFGIVSAGAVVVLLGLVSCRAALVENLRHWDTAWKRTTTMLEGSGWLGVGPGNFSREYPRYLQPGDGDPFRDPPNLFLDLAASAGLVAPLLLLAILGLFAFALWRRLAPDPVPKETTSLPAAPGGAEDRSEQPLPWEFYFGGMFGLLLGLVLRLMSAQSATDVWHEGLRALIRSAVWFVAFAALEGVPWSSRALTRALGAGVLLLLLHLLIAPGIGYSSLAVPLWVMLALALNSVSTAPNRWISPRRVGLALAVPVAVCVPIIYFLLVLSPVTSSAGNIGLAQSRGQEFLLDLRRKPEKRKVLEPALPYIRLRILGALETALADDPGNARIPLMMAQWSRQMWMSTPDDNAEGARALVDIAAAHRLDPHGQEPFLIEGHLRESFAYRLAPWEMGKMTLGLPFTIWLSEFSKVKERTAEREKESRLQAGLAAEVFTKLAVLDPTAALWHYQAARNWFRAGETNKMLEEARKALDLDELPGRPTRRLTDPQREQVRHWLAAGGKG